MAGRFGSVITAMVTPFRDDMSLDLDRAQAVTEWLLDHGSNGLVVAGTTGEGATLSDAEKADLWRATVEAAKGKGPIIAGTGTYDTAHSVHLTEEAEKAGCDAALVVSPYYNKPPQSGLFEHFTTVARATSLPVIVYNIPGRVVVNIAPDLLAELAEIENVVAVKQANNDEIDQVEGLAVLAGNDDVFLRCLETGGVGGILVASHLVGGEMREIFEAMSSGEVDRAGEIDQRIRPIYEAMTIDTNPIPVKAAAELLGLIPSARMRLPMVEADKDQRETLRKALEAQGLLAASTA